MPEPHPRAQVALETTLLVHGVPPPAAKPLAVRLFRTVIDQGATPRLVGVVDGKPVVGMTLEQLEALLAAGPRIPKVNTANAGAAMFRKRSAATTVSTTMELATGAGISVFATGGIGGVHLPTVREGSDDHAGDEPSLTVGLPVHSFDVSSDLLAFTRFPVAVVTSGVKSLLDIRATREALETLGVPVIGYRTSAFPAFYLREPDVEGVAPVDERFDDGAELARFIRFELARTRRGVVICNPIPAEHELKIDDWRAWLAQARSRSAGAAGRDATPALLGALHEVSAGATLRANIELVVSNATLAAQLARAMAD